MQGLQGLVWCLFSARLVLSGREEAQLPLSQRAATSLGASGLAQGHRAAAEEVGKQSRDCGRQLPAPAQGSDPGHLLVPVWGCPLGHRCAWIVSLLAGLGCLELSYTMARWGL